MERPPQEINYEIIAKLDVAAEFAALLIVGIVMILLSFVL